MANRIDPVLRDFLATSLAAEGPVTNERARAIAVHADISLRTLRRIIAWGKTGVRERPKLGRPAFPQAVFDRARELIELHLNDVGWRYGEGTILAAFGDAIPRSVVIRVVRELKAERKQRVRSDKLARRVGFKATAQGALW
jgi:hypothetical protein